MNRDKLRDLVEKYKIEDVKLKDINFDEERKVLNSTGENYFA